MQVCVRMTELYLWPKISPLRVFVNKVLLKHSHAHIAYCLWLYDTLGLEQHSQKDFRAQKTDNICHLTLHRKLGSFAVSSISFKSRLSPFPTVPVAVPLSPQLLRSWGLKTDERREGEWPAEFLNRMPPLTGLCIQPPHTAVCFSKEGCWAAPGPGWFAVLKDKPVLS